MSVLYWILAIIIALTTGFWVYLSDNKRMVPYPLITALLRTLVILATCLLLLAPAITIEKNETQKPILLFLQDNSASIPFALKKDTTSYRKNADELIHKLESDYKVVRWGFGNEIQKDTLFQYKQQATDIAHAFQEATEYYGQQNLGAVILASDGRFNQGLNPQYQNLMFNGSLYAVALGDSTAQKDISVTNVYANKTVMLNNQFEIRADIVAKKITGFNGSIQLKDEAGNIKASSPLNINSDHYDHGVSFVLKADQEGLHHYSINIPNAEGEQNTANNRKDVFVEVVSEKKKILIIAAAPHPDVNAIREALNEVENYEVDICTTDKLPASCTGYAVVILHNLPSQSILLQQQLSTAKAVWLIMGSATNVAVFNQIQNLAKLNVNSFNLQNLFASPNNSFNAFTLPSGISAITDKMPPLAVPGGLIQGNPNAQILFTAKSNTQMPLWMLAQGAKPTALLVGEGIWRWRLFEFRQTKNHNIVDELIRQTVAFLAANVHEKPFTVSLPKYSWSDQEQINMNAYLLNESNQQINTPNAQITIIDNNGKAQVFSFEKMGNAYRLNIGLHAAGNYAYTAKTNYYGKELIAKGSFVIQSLPLEMMETGADYPLLYALAKKYQGSLIPSSLVGSLYDSIKKNQNIKPLIQTQTNSIPLVDWKWYFFLILLFAVAEWLLRKYWMAM